MYIGLSSPIEPCGKRQADAVEAHCRAGGGKPGRDKQSDVGAVVGSQVEKHGDQRRTGGLSEQSRRGEHPAGAATSFGRGGGDQDAVVGRLEKAESQAAEHQPPHDVEVMGNARQKRQQQQSCGHHREPRSA